MIRTTLLWMFVAFLAAYAWRDWFKSLCGLILMMAVVEHPDFPKSISGVQGLNPWNILMLIIVMAWAASRRREGLIWDLPVNIKRLLIFYVIVIVVAFVRLSVDMGPLYEWAAYSGLDEPTFMGQFSEGIINCLKWVIPALLLFDGCRSEERYRLGTYCILGVYILLALQVIRWMPWSGLASGSDLSERALKILEREIGYHRVNVSMMLAGGSWAIFSARMLPKAAVVRLALIFASGFVALGMILTGGRMGIVTWAVIALVFGVLKWRKILVLAPIAMVLLISLVPAVQERLMSGFTEESIDTNSQIEAHFYNDSDGPDLYTVTAGRTFAWPFVVEKIIDSPVFGYGREAMQRTGTTIFLRTQYGESFPHPHNAYLQWVLDNGLVGFIPVFIFYWVITRIAIGLFRDKSDMFAVVAGGVCLSFVFALLVAAMGSQSFYPREGAVGMWCSIGLAIRVFVQKQYLAENKVSKKCDIDSHDLWAARPIRRVTRHI